MAVRLAARQALNLEYTEDSYFLATRTTLLLYARPGRQQGREIISPSISLNKILRDSLFS